jgi:hypothetical protein
MPETPPGGAASANPFLDVVEALSNRQGQVDIRLDRFSLKLPFAGEIELSGTMTVSVHLRELSERERKAHEGRQLRALSA